MDYDLVKQNIKSTPAFIFDRNGIECALQKLQRLRQQSDCKVLYSIKALPFQPVLEWMLPYVDGFSVSSLFEARLARGVIAETGTVHLATPGVRSAEVSELNSLCSHISCNSFHQLSLFQDLSDLNASLGARVNPKQSFVSDARYDPCRQYSKLGIDIAELNGNDMGKTIRGLHFHTVFSALNFNSLLRNLQVVRENLGNALWQLSWLNLGGGYLFDRIESIEPFVEQMQSLRRHGLEIFVEPGNGIVGHNGYLVTSVIDLFVSDGKHVAVLDTSVNHHPEVFEYQLQPQLCEHIVDGTVSVILAGSTCLAGDLFGEYRFNRMLQIGDKLIFKEVGAYTLVKANRFNGYNLPDIYSWNNGKLAVLKQYSYDDYYRQWSINSIQQG